MFHDLTGHRAAVTDVSWRPDSNALVSASEDGSLKMWGAEEGNQIKSWNAPGPVTAVEFTRDGRIVSTGRDRRVRLWKQDGGQIREFPPLSEIGLEVAFDSETDRVLGGDWTGAVKVWNAEKGDAVGEFATKPLPIAEDVYAIESRLAAAEKGASSEASAAGALQSKPDDRVIIALRAQLDALKKVIPQTATTESTPN